MRERINVLTCFVALLFIGSSSVVSASELRETAAVRAVRRAHQSVVNIHSEKTASASSPIFSSGAGRKINGMGTGILVDERGYIVTNFHVVDGVDSLRVTMSDGSAYDARIIDSDREHDLAIIKVDATRPLQAMPLGTSSDLMLGETVIAVGNAYGYEDTVTLGIVSALSRDVEVNEAQSYKNLIQTDASINPGNSGGPLINLDGEVVGINVAIRAGAERIGFAIPIDDARRVIAQLLSVERIDHTYHGIRSTDIKHGSVRKLKIESVHSDSPADQAGFEPGDVIVEVEAHAVVDQADFERALLGHKPGEPIDVVVRRSNGVQTLTLVLAESHQNSTAAQFVSAERAHERNPASETVWTTLGLRLTPVSGSRVDVRKYGYRGGMLVTHVKDGSPAARNGIQVGDVLVGLHMWETLNYDNVMYVLNHPQRSSFNPVKFYVLRGGEPLYGHMHLSF